MTIELKHFNELSLHELYEIMRLRQEVFIVEQECPYIDADRQDQQAYHLILKDGEAYAAYARLLPKGISYPDYASIGRVISAPAYRGSGKGRQVMEIAIGHCQRMWPHDAIKIGAQVYALPFYEALGFVGTGENYLEDGIPHQKMILNH